MSGKVINDQFPILNYVIGKHRPIIFFSTENYLDGDTLRSRNEMLTGEIVELRNHEVVNGQFLGTPLFQVCVPGTQSPSTLENSMLSRAPVAEQFPISVGLLFVATNRPLDDSCLDEHSVTVASNVLTLVINNDTESNFDWLLRPNLLRRSSNNYTLGGNSYTIVRDVPSLGQSTITVQDVPLADGPFTIRAAGFDMAFQDAYAEASVPAATQAEIEFVFSSGPTTEVSY